MFHLSDYLHVFSTTDIEYQSFQLDVVASDGGKPSESVYASLNIVVNRSIPFTFEHSAILAGHNFTIVVSLGCLTGVIVVILIIAIVLIKRQDNDKKGRNYNCRMQALKALHTGSNGTGDPVPPDEDSAGVVVEVATSGDGGMGSPAITTKTNGTCIYDKPALHQPNGDKPHPVKEVSFNLDHENNSLPEYSSCMVSTLFQLYKRMGDKMHYTDYYSNAKVFINSYLIMTIRHYVHCRSFCGFFLVETSTKRTDFFLHYLQFPYGGPHLSSQSFISVKPILSIDWRLVPIVSLLMTKSLIVLL